MAKRRKRVHPLVSTLALAPLAIGLATPMLQGPAKPAPHAKHVAAAAADIGACTLPFDAIKQTHSLDSSCGAAGSASNPAQSAQNEAKNNFCATGAPVNLSFANFAQLQQAAESAGISFGGTNLPPDRTQLQNILPLGSQGRVGEGSVVRLAAFVMDAHYSNVSSGESVNCGVHGIENNDIHIVLGQNPIPTGQKPTTEQECASVTAEMSPHFRPDVWVPDNLKNNNAHMFRFTGQLFFDAAHRPCVGSTGASPRRVAIWEVHPVYAVDICVDSGNHCSTDSDANWVPLSDFVGSPAPSNETRLQLPDGISGEFSFAALPPPQSRSPGSGSHLRPAL